MQTWEEKRTCEIHGEYDGKFYSIHGGKTRGGMCGKCMEKQNEERLSEEKIKRDEDKRRAEEKRKVDVRVNAGISKRNLFKGFDDYVCENKDQEKAKSSCQKFVSEFPCGKSLIMAGGVGTGKTLLASSIIDCLIEKNKCEIIKVIDVVRELKSTWAKDSKKTEEGLIEYYSNIDLLVLDEVGSQFGSDTEKLFIFDIIDGRYNNMKQTILISNLDIDGIKDAIGDRCVDRLRDGGGSMIAFDWGSHRGK